MMCPKEKLTLTHHLVTNLYRPHAVLQYPGHPLLIIYTAANEIILKYVQRFTLGVEYLTIIFSVLWLLVHPPFRR